MQNKSLVIRVIQCRGSCEDGLVWALMTWSTGQYVHRGAALPAARVIVIAVPVTIGFLYWLLIARRKGPR